MAAEPAELPTAAAEVSPATATVVVVEDDSRSLELLTLYLEAAGVEVVQARDGESGLQVIRSLRPAGVVLDIRLPKLDGWDLLGQLEGRPGHGLDSRHCRVDAR